MSSGRRASASGARSPMQWAVGAHVLSADMEHPMLGAMSQSGMAGCCVAECMSPRNGVPTRTVMQIMLERDEVSNQNTAEAMNRPFLARASEGDVLTHIVAPPPHFATGRRQRYRLASNTCPSRDRQTWVASMSQGTKWGKWGERGSRGFGKSHWWNSSLTNTKEFPNRKPIFYKWQNESNFEAARGTPVTRTQKSADHRETNCPPLIPYQSRPCLTSKPTQ